MKPDKNIVISKGAPEGMGHPGHAGRRPRGFTLIELLVVLSIIALLLSIAAPRYFQHVARTKEAVLREDLSTMREALDQYHADTGAWPQSLQELADKHYLRAVPKDPITEQQDTWATTPPAGEAGGVYDVHSGAAGTGIDGQPYSAW